MVYFVRIEDFVLYKFADNLIFEQFDGQGLEITSNYVKIWRILGRTKT